MICWTPGLVLLMLDGLGCESCQVLRYEKYCLVLAECNSLVNPIIYSFRDTDMLQTFKRILCCLCRRGGAGHKDTLSGTRCNTLEQEVLSESNGNNHHDNHNDDNNHISPHGDHSDTDD